MRRLRSWTAVVPLLGTLVWSSGATAQQSADASEAPSTAVEVVRVEVDGDQLKSTTLTFADELAADRYESRAERDPDVTVDQGVWRHLHGSIRTDINPEIERQWNIQMMGTRPAGATGAGMIVAVLDSGISQGLSPEVDARVLLRADFSDSIAEEATAHGATVADVVLQVAPDAWILDAKVGDEHGLNTNQVVNGIVWAVNNGADVLNMSFGSPTPSEAEKVAIDWAVGRGVVVVASAGNDAASSGSYPAKYPNVLAVGALDSQSRVASFSTPGAYVDAWAAGVDVPVFRGQDFATGTSFAAPHVAGLAALVAQRKPTWTPENIQAGIEVSKGRTIYSLEQPNGKVAARAFFDAVSLPDGEIPTRQRVVDGAYTYEELSFSSAPFTGYYRQHCEPWCRRQQPYSPAGTNSLIWSGRSTAAHGGMTVAVQMEMVNQAAETDRRYTRPLLVTAYPAPPAAPTLRAVRQSTLGLSISATGNRNAAGHLVFLDGSTAPLGPIQMLPNGEILDVLGVASSVARQCDGTTLRCVPPV
jgi:hypothetical protein